MEQYLAALPTLKQGVIVGVFRQKVLPPGITRAEKLQLSVLLPHLSLKDWYAGGCGLPTIWPEVSMMEADNPRKVAGYDRLCFYFTLIYLPWKEASNIPLQSVGFSLMAVT